METSVDLKPKVELSTPKETTLHTMPPVDVKPQLPADIKPRDMKKEATPTADNEDEGEEDGYEDDEVLVPSSLPSDVKPKVEILEDVKPTAADLERAERQLVEREAGEEEGEEEEYDDDDFVMAPRTAVNVATFGTAKPDVDPRTDVKQEVKMESEEDLKVKVEVKAEVKPGIDEYEEEEYEEEDWASGALRATSRLLTPQSPMGLPWRIMSFSRCYGHLLAATSPRETWNGHHSSIQRSKLRSVPSSSILRIPAW